jgi:hypothetical protein
VNIRHAIEMSGGLISLSEAGRRAGVSRERMRQYKAMEGFPDTVPIVGDTRIALYLGVEIEQWLRDYRAGQVPAQAARAVNARSVDQFERGFA